MGSVDEADHQVLSRDGPTPTHESPTAAFTKAPAEETRVRATEVAASMCTDGARVAAKSLLDMAGRA
ncbi:hypothetical protein QFZ22_005852 [Streptomyces canus]|uniref:Uncharacterized protein n=1 Tax=Streptomyces canus TaxID=58343 RepID=A0AAW8FJ81_9ACTN|nr:hypothetical protein [Streptomyces canus]MDQ0909867.1 hypothetical protein [Streptomyces canus]